MGWGQAFLRFESLRTWSNLQSAGVLQDVFPDVLIPTWSLVDFELCQCWHIHVLISWTQSSVSIAQPFVEIALYWPRWSFGLLLFQNSDILQKLFARFRLFQHSVSLMNDSCRIKPILLGQCHHFVNRGCILADLVRSFPIVGRWYQDLFGWKTILSLSVKLVHGDGNVPVGSIFTRQVLLLLKFIEDVEGMGLRLILSLHFLKNYVQRLIIS